jgi:hypothetical protein
MRHPNPAPDLSAVPGGRIFAALSLLALVLFVGQFLLSPAVAGVLLVLLALLTGLVVVPLATAAVARRATASVPLPRRRPADDADDATSRTADASPAD